jgi:tetratricopeptide (TPR) repeat protein
VHDLINKPITFIGTARGASIAIILGFIATFLLIFIKNKNKKISLFFKVSIIAYFVSLFIIIVMLFIPGTVVSNKFHNEAGGFRYIYWHQATEGFKEHPILGWGPGNFRIINAKYFNPVIYKNTLNAPETSSDKAHSIIFDNLISLGLLGSLVYLLLLFSIFITIWRSNNISHNTKSIFTGLLLSYLIQNLIFFDILTSWLMFVFLLSIILILNGEFSNLDKINFKENNKNFNKLNYIIPIALLIFGTLSIRYFAFLPIKKATNDFKFFSYSPLLRLGLYKDRVSLSTYGDIEDKEIYIAPIVDQYLSNLDFIKKQNDVIPYVKDINGLIQEISYPYGFGSESFSASNLIYKLFEIRYKLTNDNIFTLSRMKIYAQREIFLSTKNPIGYLDYANTFSYEKDYKNALIYLEKAYELCPYNKEVNIAIINATAKIGDKKLLKEKIERAKINLPTFNFNVNF